MAVTGSNLGRGFLSSSQSVIISPSSGQSTKFTIKTLKLTNTHSSQVIISLFFRWRNDSLLVDLLTSFVMDPGDSVHYLDHENVIELEANDGLEAIADIDNVVSFSAWGDKET